MKITMEKSNTILTEIDFGKWNKNTNYLQNKTTLLYQWHVSNSSICCFKEKNYENATL